MTNEEFIEKAKQIVADYAREHLDKTEIVPPFDVFVVWNCYILGNQKALLSTTMPDGMYYEVTYNATRDEIYFDAYKKFENQRLLFCFFERKSRKRFERIVHLLRSKRDIKMTGDTMVSGLFFLCEIQTKTYPEALISRTTVFSYMVLTRLK